MRVCVDIQAAIAQRAGVGRYVRSLVEHLAAQAGDDELSLFYFDFQRKGIPFPLPGVRQRAVRWCPGRIVQKAWKTIHWPPFNWFAGAADVYHFPNFIRPPLRRGKTVVTIHDVSFLRFPTTTEERNLRYLQAQIRQTVAAADAILTDSFFSAGEIEELLNVPMKKIYPTILGIREHCRRPPPAAIAAFRRAHKLEQPYLLMVGTLEPRKNHRFLIEVFEQLKDFDGDLVVAGMRGWKYEPILERMRASSQRERIRYLEYVSDEELPSLYAGADLFVFPSLYEGFGFPPLEAMTCGTPVLSSTGGALEEVLGGGAVLLRDFDITLWVDAIMGLLRDRKLREKMIINGSYQAQRFSWAATARQTWDVYRKLA